MTRGGAAHGALGRAAGHRWVGWALPVVGAALACFIWPRMSDEEPAPATLGAGVLGPQAWRAQDFVPLPPPAVNSVSSVPRTLVPEGRPPQPHAAAAPALPADPPYRFMGRVDSGAMSGVVLFGRGRVVTLHGPGPIDEEYVVDALFDDYLVLRHVPTAVGTFVALAQRRKSAPAPADPEDSARD